MTAGAKLDLTGRALRDLVGILNYSAEQWGQKTADKYLRELEAGLERLKANPNLLQRHPDFGSGLTFYRVSKHLLVCDVQSNSIVVLTVIHASMDIPSRLAELQPTLSDEVELLHRKLQGSPRRNR